MYKYFILNLLIIFVSSICTQLVHITLPGTHDSGSYLLTEKIQPYYDNQPEKLYQLIEFAEKIGINISKIITPWSISQNKNITEQLEAGIQYLDLRCGWNGTDWNIFHFETGITCQNVFNQIKEYIRYNKNKIYLIEVSHLNGSQLNNYNISQLAEQINSTLGEYLFPWRGNLLFTDCEMIQSEQPILITLSYKYTNYENIWYTDNVFHNTYADTSNLNNMTKFNIIQIKKFNECDYDKIFKLSWTLTPDVKAIVYGYFDGINSLKKLADTANGEPLNDFNNWRKLMNYSWTNIVLLDHFESSNIINFLHN